MSLANTSQQCCFIPSGTISSIHFVNGDTSWNVNYAAYEHGMCNDVKTTRGVYGTTDVCLDDGPYTGGTWDWRGNRRRADSECEKKLPDHYEDGDGKKYSLQGMSEDDLIEFISHLDNGTMPEIYHRLLF